MTLRPSLPPHPFRHKSPSSTHRQLPHNSSLASRILTTRVLPHQEHRISPPCSVIFVSVTRYKFLSHITFNSLSNLIPPLVVSFLLLFLVFLLLRSSSPLVLISLMKFSFVLICHFSFPFTCLSSPIIQASSNTSPFSRTSNTSVLPRAKTLRGFQTKLFRTQSYSCVTYSFLFFPLLRAPPCQQHPLEILRARGCTGSDSRSYKYPPRPPCH